MLGAVAPDFDLAYFYLVDERRHSHHSYWTHFPILWIGLLLLSLAWLRWGKLSDRAAFAAVFALNGLGHMVLDSVVGQISWLAPFADKPYSLFAVPAAYHIWWLNFLLHWSFVLELFIVAWAVYLWRRRPVFRSLTRSRRLGVGRPSV